MIKMKCSKCGQENKREAKFCTKCGNPLSAPAESVTPSNSNFNTKYLIIALIVVIIVLVGVIGYFALNNGSGVGDASPKASADSDKVQSNDNSNDNSNDKANDSSNDNSDSSKKTHESSSKTSSSSKSKKWVSIGRYSGSGSGSKTIKVPDGKIKVELSAYPILNYATNHLYVSGTNGESGGVDWGPTSDVETRSDSFKFTSKSEEEFTIDYYETVSWEVEFFRYQ